MAAVTVEEFVCRCMFALPESPRESEITGLSKQQMHITENNIIGSSQRGLFRGSSPGDAQITSHKDKTRQTRHSLLSQTSLTF